MSVEDSGADVCVYTSSTSFNKEVKRKQAGVLQVLDAKKIRYKNYDISIDEQAKQRLKDLLSSQPTSATTDLPQIFNRENYCGNYDDFFWAVEEATVDKFLYPKPSPAPAAPGSEGSELLTQQPNTGVTEASGAGAAPLSTAENIGKNLTGNGSSVEDEIGVYTSSTSFSKEVKRKQAGVLQVLDAKKIRYKNYDISIDEQAKQRLKDLLSSQPTSAATDLPQIFNRENYCGNYDDFFWAVEDGLIQKFLHPPETQKIENSSSLAHTIEEVGSFMVQPSANMGLFKPIDVAAEFAELASQSDEPMITLAMRKEMLVLAEKSNVNFQKVEEINQTVENEPEEPIVSLSMRKEMLGFANKTNAQVNSGFQQSVSLSKTSVVAENNTKTETKTVLSKTDTSKTVTGNICGSEAGVTSDHSVSSYETNSAECRFNTKSFLKSSELKIESSRSIAERKIMNLERNTSTGNKWNDNTTSTEMSQTVQESYQSQSSLGLQGDLKTSHNLFHNTTSSSKPSTSILDTLSSSSSKICPSSSITSSYTMSSCTAVTSAHFLSSSDMMSSQFTTSSKTSVTSGLSSTTSALPLITSTTLASPALTLYPSGYLSSHSATGDSSRITVTSNVPSTMTAGNLCVTKTDIDNYTDNSSSKTSSSSFSQTSLYSSGPTSVSSSKLSNSNLIGITSTSTSETFQTENLSSKPLDTTTLKSCSKSSTSTKTETIFAGQKADTMIPKHSDASGSLPFIDTKDQNTDMPIKTDQKITRAQWEELKTLAGETGMDEEELFKLVGQYVDENNVKTVAKESSAIQEAERIMFGGTKTTEKTKTFSSKTIELGNKQPKGLSVKIEKGGKASKNPEDPLVYENIAPDIDWNALMTVESPELLQNLLKDIIMIDSEDEEATKARLGILDTNSKEIPVLTERTVDSSTGGRFLDKSPATTKDKSPTRSPNIKMGLTSLSGKLTMTDANQPSKTSVDTSASRKLTGVLTNAPGMSTRSSTAYEISVSTTSSLTSSCGLNISTQNAARASGIHSPTLTTMSSGNIVAEKNERLAKTGPNLLSKNASSPQIITTCEGISLPHITASSSATSQMISTKINTSSAFCGKSVSTTFRIPESQSSPMYSQNVAQTTKFSVSPQYGTGRFAENQPELARTVPGLGNVPMVGFDKTISVTTSPHTTLMQTPSTVKMSSQPTIQMPPEVIVKKPQESKFPLQLNVKTTLQPSSNVTVVTRNQTFSYGAATSSAGRYNRDRLKPDEEIGLHVSSKDTKPYGAAILQKDQTVIMPNKSDSLESSPVLSSGAMTQNQTSIPQKSDKIGRAATFSDRNEPGIRAGLFGAMESVGKISTAPLLAVDTGHLQPSASPRLPGLAGFVSSKMKSRPISPHNDKSLFSALVSVGKAAVVPVAVVEPGAKKPSSSTSGEKSGRESHDFRTMGASNLSQVSSSEAGSGSGSSFVSRTTLIKTTGVTTTKPSDVTTNTTLPQYQTNKYQSDISESQARYQLRNDEFKSSYQSGISKIPSRNISSISTTSVQFKSDRTPGSTLAGSSEYQTSNLSNFSSYSGSTDSTSGAWNNKTSGGVNHPAVTLTPSATLGSVRAGSSTIGSSHTSMGDRSRFGVGIDSTKLSDKNESKTMTKSYDYHYKY